MASTINGHKHKNQRNNEDNEHVRRLQKFVFVCMLYLSLLFICMTYMTSEDASRQQPFPLFVPVNTSNGLEAYKKQWVGFPQLGHVQCTPLFLKSTRNSLYPRFLPRITAAQLGLESKDCPQFLEKYGFNRHTPVTDDEREFPLAYIILFHKDLHQVLFLLRAIYRRHNVYCLTVDLDSGPTFVNAVKTITNCFPNVFLSERLEAIVYAGFSRFKADISCMEELIKHPVEWKYLHNMPGQQFPLRTNLEIVKILKIYNGANDILGLPGKKSLPRRYKNKHRVVYNNNTGKNMIVEAVGRKSPPPHDFKIIKGSAYGSYSRAFVEFLVTNEKVRDLIEWSKDVESPDEYVFATVHHTRVMEVPGGYKGIPDQKRFLASFAAWEKETPCASIYVRWICIFTTADLPMLLARQELFANKFYIDHYPATLHCLDQYLYNLTVLGITRDLDFYRTLGFVRSS